MRRSKESCYSITSSQLEEGFVEQRRLFTPSCLKSDFANESVCAPVKARFPLKLDNHLFNDPPAKALARRRLYCRTARLHPTKV
jgi:hypothetical protein